MSGETFTLVDYIVFAASLLLSAAIGVYYACAGEKQSTTKEFLTGGKNMSVFPVALSLVASFLSAISVLGVPAEFYYYGTQFFMWTFVSLTTFPIIQYVHIPVFCSLNITTAYEYLELRFNRVVRVLATITFIIQMNLYMAVALYAPALALSQVTGMSLWASILGSGVICTFYTSIGGMKAVVWTDSFQMLVILIGLLAVIIKGCMEAGGLGEVWRISGEGGRLIFFNLDPDPTVRTTFWSMIIGGTFMSLTAYSANQATIQRYLSVKNAKKASIAMWLNAPLWAIANVLFLLVGLSAYARYHDCDPFVTQRISKPDQLVAFYVLDILGFIKGLPGLFTASCFSAALSTVSSGVNSLAAVLLVDIVKPCYHDLTGKHLSEKANTSISKWLAVFFGFLAIALAFAVQALGDALVEIAISFFGMVGGPLMGLFTLAMVMPSLNSNGAMAGLCGSMAFIFWVGFGAMKADVKPPILDLSVAGCPIPDLNVSFRSHSFTFSNDSAWNFTTMATATTELSTSLSSIASLMGNTTIQNDAFAPGPVHQEEVWVNPMYKLSYMYYSLASLIVFLIIGGITSALTGGNRKPTTANLYWPPALKYCTGPPPIVKEMSDMHVEQPEKVKPNALDQLLPNDYTPDWILDEKHFLSLCRESDI